MRFQRRLLIVPAVLALVVACAGPGAVSSNAAPVSPGFVALGDSYAAGPIVPSPIVSAGLCLQSNHNYAHLLAPVLRGMTFRDASCSGAQTTAMTRTQQLLLGTNPPQFNRLTGATAVVTLEIGGNDIGFTSIGAACGSIVPWGTPCRNAFVRGTDDRLFDAIKLLAPKIGAVIDGIHARAPYAHVFVLGYPAIVPYTGAGCWPRLPVTAGDVAYLRTKQQQLNGTIAMQTILHRATYVDVYGPSVGRDACAPASIRWIEPLIPGHPAAPVHPNARGEAAMAVTIRRAMGR